MRKSEVKPKYLRAAQIANIYGIGLSTVWYFAKQGFLRPIKFSKNITFFDPSEVEAFFMRKAAQDEAEKRRYLRFYAYLSKYPDIKAIYAQKQDSELKEGVIKALSVAFDLFEERENEINQKAIADFASECKDLKSAPEHYEKMLEACYPDIYLKYLQDERDGSKTANFKDVAFDLFLALSKQNEQMQELLTENERFALTFLTTKGASNGAK